MEINGFLTDVGKEVVGGILLAVLGAVFLWVRSFKVTKRKEYNRLKALEAEHKGCKADLAEPPASRFINTPRRVTVDSSFSHFNPKPVQTFKFEPDPLQRLSEATDPRRVRSTKQEPTSEPRMVTPNWEPNSDPRFPNKK
jgi:hypothetical protein